jgi:hypothetical protein
MQTGSSGTLIGWKSGQTTFVPLWDRMEVAWLRTQEMWGGGRHLAATCPKISTWTHNFGILEKSLYYLYLSIAIGLDRKRCRNIRGETETEIVRNSKVIVDSRFEHESQKKVASLPILGRFTLSI